MPINSRQKGKRVELEACKWLRSLGIEARRGQQFAGAPDGSAPDIVVPSIPGVHWEVKGVERLNLWNAMAQAKRDSGGKLAVVLHKKNGTNWMISMDTDHFLCQVLLQALQSATKKD